MADTAYYNCNIWGECYYSRWHSWGRWVFLAFMIIGFFLFSAMCLALSARRRRIRGMTPLRGTGWLAPKTRFVPQPGPMGPTGYYPPPSPQAQQQQHHHTDFYTPPPYTPSAQFTGTTDPHDNYYAPPPGPPPPHQVYEMHSHPSSPAPPVPLSSHPTGSSYVQSNNPFQPSIAAPPQAHVEQKK